MKILADCPGSWSHGLDSPEWGEGRWAQNVVKMLAWAGHEIYATSGGNPTWGITKPIPNVKLIHWKEAKDYETFDLYFDSAAWIGKPIFAKAKWYLFPRWWYTEETAQQWPDNWLLSYPYKEFERNFMHESNPNLERTFFLPTMLAKEFDKPKFNEKELLWPSRDAFGKALQYANDATKNANYVFDVLKETKMKVNWLFNFQLEQSPHYDKIKDINGTFYDRLPYFQLRELIQKCKLSLPINQLSSVIDCMAEGVPSLIWENGGYFHEAARKVDLLIKKDASKNEIKDIIFTLLNDELAYNSLVYSLQDYLKDHLYKNTLEHWKYMFKKIGF